MRKLSLVLFLLPCFWYLAKAQFVHGDANGRTSFLNTPSSLIVDPANDKLRLDFNNLAVGKSKLSPFLWGASFTGGSDGQESFLFQGGDFVYSSEANGFIGFSTRLDPASTFLKKLLSRKYTLEGYDKLADKYNQNYNNLLKGNAFSGEQIEDINDYFFLKKEIRGGTKTGTRKPFNTQNADNFLSKPQVKLVEVTEYEFANKVITSDGYRKHLSTASNLNLTQAEIDDIRDKFLKKAKTDADLADAPTRIYNHFKPIIQKYEGNPAKRDALAVFFFIDLTTKKAISTAYKNITESKEKVPSDKKYFDAFLSKQFNYDLVVKIRDMFYIPVLAEKLVNAQFRSQLSDEREVLVKRIESLEARYGAWRLTGFFKAGIFGQNFTRIDTLTDTDEIPDGLSVGSPVFTPEDFRGNFYELGMNLSGRGKHYLGISYRWIDVNSLNTLSSSTYAIARTASIGGTGYQVTESQSAYSGDYITYDRGVFSIDYALMFDFRWGSAGEKEQNTFSINPYYRYFRNKHLTVRDEAALGIGFNFFKEDKSFLFGIFLQKTDIGDNTKVRDEKFVDTIDFGFRVAYSFNRLDKFK